jgi:hypothetical protein
VYGALVTDPRRIQWNRHDTCIKATEKYTDIVNSRWEQ